MDRCAVFVDAGYLYAEGGKLCCATAGRRTIRLDAAGCVQLLVELARARCDLPVLRTYWYDGARHGVPTPEHQQIAALANVKVRLGGLTSKNRQKGVDALIYRDLMTLSRERAISDAFVLAGDEDLREGVRSAQDMGVRVTLVGITPAVEDFNQSRELLNEADEVIVLERHQLAPFAGTTEPAAAAPAPTPSATAREHGRQFAERWWGRATESDRAALLANRPRIPVAFDVQLLLHVENELGITLRGEDGLRTAARAGFWDQIAAAADAGRRDEGGA